MRDLITTVQKHLLWKDECGDTFLLLPWCEIFRYSENELRLFAWSWKKATLLRKRGFVLNELETDEDYSVLNIDRRNLGALITLGSYKRRPNIKGNIIKSLEKRLGHKIRPFNPELA